MYSFTHGSAARNLLVIFITDEVASFFSSLPFQPLPLPMIRVLVIRNKTTDNGGENIGMSDDEAASNEMTSPGIESVTEGDKSTQPDSFPFVTSSYLHTLDICGYTTKESIIALRPSVRHFTFLPMDENDKREHRGGNVRTEPIGRPLQLLEVLDGLASAAPLLQHLSIRRWCSSKPSERILQPISLNHLQILHVFLLQPNVDFFKYISYPTGLSLHLTICSNTSTLSCLLKGSLVVCGLLGPTTGQIVRTLELQAHSEDYSTMSLKCWASVLLPGEPEIHTPNSNSFRSLSAN